MELMRQTDAVTWLADINGRTRTVFEFEGELALQFHVQEIRLAEHNTWHGAIGIFPVRGCAHCEKEYEEQSVIISDVLELETLNIYPTESEEVEWVIEKND